MEGDRLMLQFLKEFGLALIIGLALILSYDYLMAYNEGIGHFFVSCLAMGVALHITDIIFKGDNNGF
jgi:hypothetical protein